MVAVVVVVDAGGHYAPIVIGRNLTAAVDYLAVFNGNFNGLRLIPVLKNRPWVRISHCLAFFSFSFLYGVLNSVVCPLEISSIAIGSNLKVIRIF